MECAAPTPGRFVKAISVTILGEAKSPRVVYKFTLHEFHNLNGRDEMGNTCFDNCNVIVRACALYMNQSESASMEKYNATTEPEYS